MEHDASDDAGQELPAGTVPLRNLTRGRVSVARAPTWWYVAATSDELGAKPLAREILDVPLALFRDAQGVAHALLDRCPHRNVPLSEGEVVAGELQCPYHGWRFDGGGACRHIPSRVLDDADGPARRVPSFPVKEQDGFVWVFPSLDVTPTRAPYRFQYADAPGYASVRQIVEAEGTLHATVENALDVPHTAFLHRGLFRADSRGITITAKVRRSRDRVEAEYLGEPRPPGVVARLLSPSGGTVTHFDRFLLPCIAEVEYRLGDENHLMVASAMTPVRGQRTRIYALVSFKLRVPHELVKRALRPLAMRIFAQDAVVLAKQTETVKRFGGEQFASTEIDVLGGHIWRLLRAAERGEIDEDPAMTDEASVSLVV
jgi:phenylpropionate dioxygenase-like ring-hydroxylating dioxygenase large terminal subunit